MAAIKHTNLFLPGVQTSLILESVGILISEADFPLMLQDIDRYYSSTVVPMPRASKFTWTNIHGWLRNSTDQLVVVVKNITTPSSVDISVKKMTPAVQTLLDAEPPSTRYYVIEKCVFDNFKPKNIGFAALVGQKDTGEFIIYLVRQDLRIPPGGAGEPYAGARIPNS